MHMGSIFKTKPVGWFVKQVGRKLSLILCIAVLLEILIMLFCYDQSVTKL